MGPVNIRRSCSGSWSTILERERLKMKKIVWNFELLLEIVHVEPDFDVRILEEHVLKHCSVSILGQVLPGVIEVPVIIVFSVG